MLYIYLSWVQYNLMVTHRLVCAIVLGSRILTTGTLSRTQQNLFVDIILTPESSVTHAAPQMLGKYTRGDHSTLMGLDLRRREDPELNCTSSG